ncbi:hypothetical protein GCM10011414_13600 [Croceivirga lutea]|uniref:hypothetical protein n=1 Tax=Croceivirga lutea TaxID=1775167 RepID=UPI00163AB3A9|nr:hypothetical protein [Croceivirga lutea]GGG45317.1 hypothetical protein GCM10011414_13600 [Croceivirga lutea]
MPQPKRTLKITLSALLLWSVVGLLTLSAQEKQHFSGPYQIGKYKGEADFTFTIQENDSILEGSFLMQKSSAKALLADGDDSFSFVGNFTKGKPTGFWKLQSGSYQSGNGGQVVDYQYQLNLNGVQNLASGTMIAGKPDGEWIITVDSIENSKVKTNLFKSQIEFSEGKPVSNFKLENENYTLIGRVLRNGLAHDEWTLFANDAIDPQETWTFENGTLVKVSVLNNSETVSTPLFSTSENELVESKLNKPFLAFVSGLIAKKQGSSSAITSVLIKNSTYYKEVENIFTALGTAEFQPNFKIKVPYYPIDTVETRLAASITKTYQKADSLTSSIVTNSHLNIVKRSNSRVQFLYAVVEQLKSTFLQPLAQVVQLEQNELLPYVNRKNLVATYWVNPPTKTITTTISGSTETFSAPNTDMLDFTGGDLQTVANYSEYTLKALQAIYDELAQDIKQGEQLASLAALEEKLLSRTNVIEQVLKATEGELPETHTKAIQALKDFAEKELSIYAAMPEGGNKLRFGQQLEQCLAQLDQLAEYIADEPASYAEVQQLYTDQVWNPFMYIIMDETVKKRLTGAYESVLRPYFFETITTNLDCSKTENLLSQFKGSIVALKRLRKEDTRKLERKLKREKDPKVVLQLFNLENNAE